jgi:uncharacterized protein YfeS
MKYAVIIKHPYRDNDYRVDLVDVPMDTRVEDIHRVIMSRMLGPFEVIAITAKVSDRLINDGLESILRETENHIDT